MCLPSELYSQSWDDGNKLEIGTQGRFGVTQKRKSMCSADIADYGES